MIRAAKVTVKLAEKKLLKQIKAKRRKVLYKQGAYLRTTMRRSMRYATKTRPISKPGETPVAHKDTKRGPLLRKLILFEVDRENGSVICGPKLTRRTSPTVPEVLDKGGRVRPQRGLLKGYFEVGDYGPIRYLGGKKFARVLLETPAQVERASRLMLEENTVRAGGREVYIAPRPFTEPMMSDGGENFRKLLRDTPL